MRRAASIGKVLLGVALLLGGSFVAGRMVRWCTPRQAPNTSPLTSAGGGTTAETSYSGSTDASVSERRPSCATPGQLLWLKSFDRDGSDGLFALASSDRLLWWAGGYSKATGASSSPSAAWLIAGDTEGHLEHDFMLDLPGPIRSLAVAQSGPAFVPFDSRATARRLVAKSGSLGELPGSPPRTRWIGVGSDHQVVLAAEIADPYAAKLASNNVRVRAIDAESSEQLWERDVPLSSLDAADASRDGVSLCGRVHKEPGAEQVQLVHLDSQGRLKWTQHWGNARPDGCLAVSRTQDGRVVVLGSLGQSVTIDGRRLLSARRDPHRYDADADLLVFDSAGQPVTALLLGGDGISLEAVAVNRDIFVGGNDRRDRPFPTNERPALPRPQFDDPDYGAVVACIDVLGKKLWQWPAPSTLNLRHVDDLSTVRALMVWNDILLVAGEFTGTLYGSPSQVVRAGRQYDAFVAALCP